MAKARMTPRTQRFVVFLTVLFTALSAGALWLLIQHSGHAQRLADEGVEADAEIIQKYTDTDVTTQTVGSTAPERSVTTYLLRYRFPLQDGTPFETEESVGERVYNEIEEGDVYVVTYWPGDPEIASLFDAPYDESNTALFWAMVISAIIAGGLIVLLIRGRRPAS